MKGKKAISIIMCVLLLISISACSVKTKSDTKPVEEPTTSTSSNDQPNTSTNSAGPVDLTLLAMSSNETIVNIVRDQLSKNGFNIELNIQPDYSSFKSQVSAGNYDIMITNWMTGPGNGDYAVRSLFTSSGDYNDTHISNPEVDKLVDEAAELTSDKAVDVYRQLEEKLVTENAYIIPLYNSQKNEAYNKILMEPIRVKKGREPAWEQLDFVDKQKRDSEPLIMTNKYDVLTSLDPIKANDGSTIMENTNLYVRLMNLDDENIPTTDGSLSYEKAIAEGNREVYFILRDDINFSKVENMKAVDSGELVGAEDVVFSLNRAKDKDAVPDHRTYSIHNALGDVDIITDLKSLDEIKTTGTDDSIRKTLEAAIPTPITELTENKEAVDNASGKYQVVRVSTKTPFPQIINTLAHPSAGILCKRQVESVNTYDMASYDRNKDVTYGDQSTITEGETYNNTLYCSGPYIAVYKNDYEIMFEKNPAYMKGTEYEPKVKQISSKIIKDQDSAISALRSGEVYYTKSVPDTHCDLLKDDPVVQLVSKPGNGVTYMACSLSTGSPCSDINLRQAILYTINQDDIVAVYKNTVKKAFSTLTPVVDTGLELNCDLNKAQEFLNKYMENK